ncbi:hypothetical protein IKG28_01030 [Candidatus Saccharibacteria bacterium]|nr:hypothetical protein [Candidatus Saccharibacteria bacterium]
MVTSGLVLWAVVPALTSCSSAAQVSILPTTTAVGTAVGPSVAWSWQFYPNTEDKGFVYSSLFFVRGGRIYSRTLYYAGYNGGYCSSTVQSGTLARSLDFGSGGSNPQNSNNRSYGFSLRCLALYPATGDKGFTARPLFFVRGGRVGGSISLVYAGYGGRYWSSVIKSSMDIYNLGINGIEIYLEDTHEKYRGFSLRCVTYIIYTEDKGFVYSPLFFVRGGRILYRTLDYAGYGGGYWSSTVQSDTVARLLNFSSGGSNTQYNYNRYLGFFLRCVASNRFCHRR